MKAIVPAALLAMLTCASAQAAQTIRYVVLVDDGKQAGEQVVEHRDDGSTKVRFIFKDNGRGPELEEEYRLRADGTYAEYRVTGTTTFGAPVSERFVREGDSARWESTSEKASRKVEGAALFVPLGGTPQSTSVAIGALARNGGDALPLLPAGELRQRVLQEAQVQSDGETRNVQLLAHTGLGLSPTLVWATKGEGQAPPRMFAFIVPGFVVAIEDGWEGNAETLTELQKKAQAGLVGDMARRQFRRLDGLTVIRNARVFDSVEGRLGAPSDVYVVRDRITAVFPAGSPTTDADNEIDAGGRVLLPGLFDMHAHVFDKWEGALHLAAGVTTVRDMGNDNATLQELIDQVGRGEVLGPQVVPCGFLEGESPFSARNGFVVSTLEQARHAIDWYAQRGYPQLKIYNSFPKEILAETVAYAHERGLRVSGHVPVFLRAQDVVDAGFDEIQHINQLMLNFMVGPTTDTRTLERFRLPAEQTAELDFDSAPVQDFIASLKANDVAVDPTLATFDYIRQRAGETSKAYAAVVDHMPLSLQRQFRSAEMDIPDEATARRYDRSYGKMVEFVGRLHEAGVTVLPGTDAIAGFTLHRELELYVQAGMTPVEALQSATSVAARVARLGADRGRIAPGYRADLVLVDGDPTTDIGAMRRIALVLTQGGVLTPGELYAEMGVRPFVADPPAVRSKMTTSPLQAADARDAGLDLETACLDCHRAEPARGDVPVIEGQQRNYLVHQLERFRDRHREGFPMSGLASGLDDVAIEERASELSARPWRSAQAAVDPEAVERGKARAAGLDCAGCHYDTFLGGGDVPRIAGQHPGYLARQIRSFGKGHRYHPPTGVGTRMYALSAQEAEDIAAYLNALGQP